jgi:hypothetical protein
MESININKALRQWRKKYGKEASSSKYGTVHLRMPLERQRKLIMYFFRWMKMHGYTEPSRFSKQTFKDELANIWLGTAKWTNPESRKNAHEAICEVVDDILAVEGIFEGNRFKKKNKSKSKYTPPPAMPERVEKLQFTPKTNPDTEEEETKRVGRPVNKALYANVSGHKAVIDEEFKALIQEVKDNE